jgi:hypothetical protein
MHFRGRAYKLIMNAVQLEGWWAMHMRSEEDCNGSSTVV